MNKVKPMEAISSSDQAEIKLIQENPVCLFVPLEAPLYEFWH